MADWNLAAGGNDFAGAAILRPQLFGDAAANVKGAWVEFHSALPFQAGGIHFLFDYIGNQGAITCLMDVAIGASGSEVIVLPDFFYSNGPNTTARANANASVPVVFPLGARVAGRASFTGGSFPYLIVTPTFVAMPDGITQPFQTVVTYGAVSGRSGGLGVEASTTTSGVKGAWVEITSATSQQHRGLIANFGHNANGVTPLWGGTDVEMHVDIGVGASGSETILIRDWQVTANITSGVVGHTSSPCFPVDIPAGTRLSMRLASENVGSADQRTMFTTLYGLS